MSGAGHASWANVPAGAPEPGKRAIRAELQRRRSALTRGQRLVAAAALRTAVLGFVADPGATAVGCYVPTPTEPGSPVLLDALHAAGSRVLLPVVLADNDLDWAEYAGAASLRRGARGTAEPVGERLGRTAVAGVDLLVVPALAVDTSGHRLGRGGGSYDRALSRLPDGVPVLALLFDGELLDRVPVEPHDRPVTHVATPAGGLHAVPRRP